MKPNHVAARDNGNGRIVLEVSNNKDCLSADIIHYHGCYKWSQKELKTQPKSFLLFYQGMFPERNFTKLSWDFKRKA